MIIVNTSEQAAIPFCTGIVHLIRPRGNAGSPCFLDPELGGASGGVFARGRDCDQTMTTNKALTNVSGGTGRRARPAPRQRVVSRLWRTAERHVAEIEARLMSMSDDPGALERDAKTLAIIAKTIRDLVAIDCEAEDRARARLKENDPTHGGRTITGGEGEEGASARDIEDFRAELARRLDQLRGEGTGGEAP